MLYGTSQCHLVWYQLKAEPTSKSDASSKLDWVAQGQIQPSLEELQGWRLHNSQWSESHCSLEVVWYLNTAYHAAVWWANGSSCTGWCKDISWFFGDVFAMRAFLLVPHENAIIIDTGKANKDSVSCCFFFIFVSLDFREIFPAKLSEHLSYFDILFTNLPSPPPKKKKHKKPQ